MIAELIQRGLRDPNFAFEPDPATSETFPAEMQLNSEELERYKQLLHLKKYVNHHFTHEKHGRIKSIFKKDAKEIQICGKTFLGCPLPLSRLLDIMKETNANETHQGENGFAYSKYDLSKNGISPFVEAYMDGKGDMKDSHLYLVHVDEELNDDLVELTWTACLPKLPTCGTAVCNAVLEQPLPDAEHPRMLSREYVENAPSEHLILFAFDKQLHAPPSMSDLATMKERLFVVMHFEREDLTK